MAKSEALKGALTLHFSSPITHTFLNMKSSLQCVKDRRRDKIRIANFPDFIMTSLAFAIFLKALNVGVMNMPVFFKISALPSELHRTWNLTPEKS